MGNIVLKKLCSSMTRSDSRSMVSGGKQSGGYEN